MRRAAAAAGAGVAVACADALVRILTGPTPECRDTPWHGAHGCAADATLHPCTGSRGCQRDSLGDEVTPGAPVCVITAPHTLRARLPRDHPNNRGPIIGRHAVPVARIRPLAWRSRGVALGGAWFPRRSGSVHPPPRRCRSSRRSARWRSGWHGGAAAGSGAVSVTAPACVRGGPSARPWPCRGAAAPAWPVVAASVRRPSSSAAGSRPPKPDRGQAGKGTCARTRRRAVPRQRGPVTASAGRWRASQIRQRRPSRRSPLRTVNHRSTIPYSARWLHMSLAFNAETQPSRGWLNLIAPWAELLLPPFVEAEAPRNRDKLSCI